MIDMKRESYLRLLDSLRDVNVIKVVTGVRRSGKSTLFEQYRKRLEEDGVPKERILFYNLEAKANEVYTKDANLLHDVILNSVVANAKNYVFIDEVQLVPE